MMSSRVGVRLFGLLLLGIVLSFSLLAYLIGRKEKADHMQFYREQSALLADSIKKDVREAMIQKNFSIAETSLSNHSNVDAGVFRPDGSRIFGSLDYSIPPEIIASPKEILIESKDKLIFLKPLLNETACHSCHNPQDRIRGLVAIGISTEMVAKEISGTQKGIAFFALIMIILSGGALILVIRKIISEPLTVLKNGAERIRSGDLKHRIDVGRKDELGDFAASFNRMAEQIEHAHKNLEDAVQRKTKELRIISELSPRVFRGDLTLKEIIERFLSTVTEDLGYSFSTLCLIDRETGMLSVEYSKGLKDSVCAPDIALTADHPFAKTILSATPVVGSAEDLGIPNMTDYLAIMPIISHRKKRCREINGCQFMHCPAYSHPDERCWLIEGTLCRSPHAVRGKAKIYGCLYCDALPLTGVLVAGSGAEIGKSSLHSLNILSSEIASAIENHEHIEEKKKDIQELIRLHDVSVEKIQSLDMRELASSIASSAASFAKADQAILWRWQSEDGKNLSYIESFGIASELVPRSVGLDGFVGKAVTENRPLETIQIDEVTCLSDAIKRYGFLYAASVPLREKESITGCITILKKDDFLMTDSEKAIISLFASQAAAAINTAELYEELKRQKEFSDTIFNSAASGVMVLDNDGVIIRINQAGSEILQVMPEEALGRKISDLYPTLADMLVINPTLTRELEIRPKKNGTAKPIGFTNSPFLDEQNEEKGIIIVFRDLTEIKSLQVEIRKKQHFESMGKVISGVAHEIRNPLFAIQSFAQILERETESPQHQAFLKAMLKETGRMRNLIEELLLYSRPSKLNIIDLELGLLFEELRAYVAVRGAGVSVSTAIPPATFIKADKDKIMQVFLNLMNNAVAAGCKNLDVSVEKRADTLMVFVKDDGIGIKNADVEKIFDPFFTTNKDGTGLGLPICRKIIEDHGGTIEIESEEGKGTTAVLTFKTG